VRGFCFFKHTMHYRFFSYYYNMPSMLKLLLFVFLLLIAVSGSGQNKVQQMVPDKTRILFVLDGSGSMEAAWDQQQSRMDVAKAILTRLVDSLRIDPALEIALRVYGHQSPRQANNCKDSRLEVPFAPRNHGTVISRIKSITPKGVTPITFAIEQAAKDFPSAGAYRNIMILITDGVESCGGDPCRVSRELQRKGVFLRPFIIAALDCVGKFIDSENANSFNKVLNESIKASLATTTVSIDLLNGQGKSIETNIDVSFVNNITGISSYEFVHYRDQLGRPDSVRIDQVVAYDIIVNTVPPVIKKNVEFISGAHNLISIPVPQGNLMLKPEGRGNNFAFLVREKGKSETLNVQKSNDPYRYLEGSYEVETFTLPKRIFNINIIADQTLTISLPATGLVNINSLMKGIGTIFEVSDTGESKWVCNLAEDETIHSYNLLPGTYKIAFRAKQAGGSKFTRLKTIEVKSGVTLNINMFQ
jgi:Ca-activated chloride channel homolog